MSQDNGRDLLPLLVILESIGKIEIYTTSFESALDFFQHADQLEFNASLLLLINIGEQINKLSTNLKNKYPHLPIDEVRDLRNRIAHYYTGIDYEMVFDIIKTDIPLVNAPLQIILRSELMSGNLDYEELNAAKDSSFYRHVNFCELGG